MRDSTISEKAYTNDVLEEVEEDQTFGIETLFKNNYPSSEKEIEQPFSITLAASNSEEYYDDSQPFDSDVPEIVHRELTSIYLYFIEFSFSSKESFVVDLEPGYILSSQGDLACEICFEYNLQKGKSANCSECATQVCFVCLSQHIEYKIKDGVIQIHCPGNGSCSKYYSDRLMEVFAEKGSMAILTKNRVAAERNPNIKTCPGCHKIERKNISDIRIGKELTKIDCSCQISWCFSCYSPWHQGMSCKAFQKDVVASGQKALRYWAKCKSGGSKNAKKCPKCHFYIERVSGCDHMNCSRYAPHIFLNSFGYIFHFFFVLFSG